MKIESLLRLGKLDPGLREPDTPLDIRDFARLSKVAEDVGLDAVLVEETKDDPFRSWPSVPRQPSASSSEHRLRWRFPEADRDCDVGVVVGKAR